MINKKLTQIFQDIFPNIEKKLISEMKQDELTQWDSLQHLRLIMSIEDEFKIKISTETINKLQSFKKIENFLKKLKK
jgi:acyl carrier protein